LALKVFQISEVGVYEIVDHPFSFLDFEVQEDVGLEVILVIF
jgi:hypothetical protein